MPTCSGVDPPSGIRLSQNYFRCVEREWLPRTVDDPDFPNLIYAAGKSYGWKLRELCIARTLFEAGARISEIAGLSVLDWAYSQFMNRLAAKNKGSFGVRTKCLVISHPTAKLYRKYFDDEVEGRRAHDPRHLSLADVTKTMNHDPQALAKISLFLTRRGTPMSARVFRECHWTPALRCAGIDADPHMARHWFVTNALRNIEVTANDGAAYARRKQELIQYMKWSTGERTLKVSEHLRRAFRFSEQLAGIHKTMQGRERTFATKHKKMVSGEPPTGQETAGMSPELAYLLGEDEGD
jgi:site-specific recombinase XerD